MYLQATTIATNSLLVADQLFHQLDDKRSEPLLSLIGMFVSVSDLVFSGFWYSAQYLLGEAVWCMDQVS